MNSSDAAASTAGLAAMGVIIVVYIVILLAFAVFSVFIHWKIAAKAGYPGWWGLVYVLSAITLVGPLVLMILFTFTEWPVERVARLAGWVPGQPGGGVQPAPGYTPPPAPPAGYLPPGSQPPATGQWSGPDQPPPPPTA